MTGLPGISDSPGKSVSRRDLLRAGAGIAAIIAAGKAPAAFIKSMLAARNALRSGGGAAVLSARDYVQDGLVAMWDGIENAGFGTHDNSATVWKDLSGNGYHLTLKNGAHFTDDSLVSADRNSLTAVLAEKLPYATIEACAFHDLSRNTSGLICLGNSIDNQRMLAVAEQGIQIYNGNHSLTLTTAVDSKSTWSGVHDEGSHIPYIAGRLAAGTYRNNNWTYRSGNFGLSGTSNYSQYNFVGNYYNVRLYSRALTADEIAANYAVDKARFNLPT